MNKKNERQVFFYIGTEAELIKVFPILMECKINGIPYKVIASGQNDIYASSIWDLFECGEVDLEVNHVRHITTGMQLLTWWVKTDICARRRIKKAFPNADFKNSIMVVHGDTVSTFGGARVGRRLGMKVAHVEAGLRSYSLLNPFPEEIDRILTSRIARIHFAPGDIPAENLKRAKGEVINTKYNTLIDSLRYSMEIPLENDNVKKLVDGDSKYFVFVMHRQENLIREEFVREVVNRIAAVASKGLRCAVILHAITRNTLAKLGILELIKYNPNFVIMNRIAYSDFMKLLDGAQFVITDGGSNQEELYYMGKPCLIIRKCSEREEGIGQNASFFGGDYDEIIRFAESHMDIKCPPVKADLSPAHIISSELGQLLHENI